jgi:hypothetical protein
MEATGPSFTVTTMTWLTVISTLHSQFRSVCHGMKQTYLHIWYPLFKLNGIDAISEITKSRIIQ